MYFMTVSDRVINPHAVPFKLTGRTLNRTETILSVLP